MGLISKDIPLATVTYTDKKTKAERVFEMAIIKLNLPAITLEGGIEENTKLPLPILNTLRAPINRANEWVTNWSNEFRLNAEFVVVRERQSDGAIVQSWAFRIADLTKPKLKKLIASSGLIDPQKGPIIPRFVMEVGAVRNEEGALASGIVMRPAGHYFSSKPAKGKSKSP